jgi:hypothetical protein
VLSVAEVKPHYACTLHNNGSRVARYVAGLAHRDTSIIATIQLQFALEKPLGYTAFGSACVDEYIDNVVGYVRDADLAIVSPIGNTTVGNYSLMPYVYDGSGPAEGDMCATGNLKLTRERAWGGVVVRHLLSGAEFCVITGTFPHADFSWGAEFPAAVDASCAHRPLLFLVDTNAQPDSLTFDALCQMQNVSWGTCSDPGVHGDATCCDDISQGVLYPRFRSDRIALCRGGTVENFTVESAFVCDTNEEHRFTRASVTLLPTEILFT